MTPLFRLLFDQLDVPLRAGLVLGGFAFVSTLTAASGVDVLARWLQVPVEWGMWFFRVAAVLIPVAIGVGVTLRGRAVSRR